MSLTKEAWTFVNDGAPLDKNPNYKCIITCTDQKITLEASLPESFQIDVGANYDEAFSQLIGSIPLASKVAPWAKAFGLQLTTQALTAQIWNGSTELAFSLPLVFQAETSGVKDVLSKLRDLYTLVLPDESELGGFLTAPGPRLDPVLLAKSAAQAGEGLLNAAPPSIKSLADSTRNEINGITSVVGGIATQLGLDLNTVKSFAGTVANKVGLTTATRGTPEATGTPDYSHEGRNHSAPTSLLSSIKNNISLKIGNYMFFESVVITSLGQNHYVQPLADGTMSRVEVTVGFKTFFVPTKKDISKIFIGMPSAQSGVATSANTAVPGPSTGADTDSDAPSGTSDSGLVGPGPTPAQSDPSTDDKTMTLEQQRAAQVEAAGAEQDKASAAILAEAPPGSTIDPVTGNVLNSDSSVNVELSRKNQRAIQGLP